MKTIHITKDGKDQELTLDDVWDICLSMWKDIAEEVRYFTDWQEGYNYALPEGFVSSAKKRWLDDFGYDIKHSCLFCRYSIMVGRYSDISDRCPSCPGVLVDPEFNCMDEPYCFETRPLEFYDKLVELHEKYKEEKKYPLFNLKG